MSVMYVVCVSVILFEDFNTLLSRYVAPPLVAAQPHDSATSLVRAVAAQVVGQEVKTLSGILTAGGAGVIFWLMISRSLISPWPDCYSSGDSANERSCGCEYGECNETTNGAT